MTSLPRDIMVAINIFSQAEALGSCGCWLPVIGWSNAGNGLSAILWCIQGSYPLQSVLNSDQLSGILLLVSTGPRTVSTSRLRGMLWISSVYQYAHIDNSN